MLPAFIPGQSCPCGCGVTGSKLSLKTGHVVKDCGCKPCIGRRSQKKGKRHQAQTHRALGGTGFTPANEESARPYEVSVTVMPEVKSGAQVPASFDRFIATDWFRRALSQSERAVPVGSGALPCVVIRSQFAIVDIRPRSQVSLAASGLLGKERTEMRCPYCELETPADPETVVAHLESEHPNLCGHVPGVNCCGDCECDA